MAIFATFHYIDGPTSIVLALSLWMWMRMWLCTLSIFCFLNFVDLSVRCCFPKTSSLSPFFVFLLSLTTLAIKHKNTAQTRLPRPSFFAFVLCLLITDLSLRRYLLSFQTTRHVLFCSIVFLFFSNFTCMYARTYVRMSVSIFVP